MEKRNKIIYWIATVWLSLGMVSTGIGQLLKMKEGQGGAEMLAHLGFPPYFLTLLGICKFLGVIALLVPRFPLLKEWAYAGFLFIMAGAVFSHLAAGDTIVAVLPSLFLIVLITVSWYLRPANRKLSLATQSSLA